MQIELKELVDLVAPKTRTFTASPLGRGFCILIADRGHVWAGELSIADGWHVLTRAAAIRIWGTTKGLGELAAGGPTAKTVLDPVSEVRVTERAVIAVIPCDGAKWKL